MQLPSSSAAGASPLRGLLLGPSPQQRVGWPLPLHGLAADAIKSVSGSDAIGGSIKLSKLDDPASLAALLAAEGIDLIDLEIRLVV